MSSFISFLMTCFQSHQETSSKEIEQLKLDFSFALQDKLVLEERLHKGQKLIKELQTVREPPSRKACLFNRWSVLGAQVALAM